MFCNLNLIFFLQFVVLEILYVPIRNSELFLEFLKCENFNDLLFYMIDQFTNNGNLY